MNRLCIAWVAGGLLLAAPLFAAPPKATDAWRELADGRYREAWQRFEDLAVAVPSARRESQVGQALALLQFQPRTASNVAEARRRCEAVILGDSRDLWTLQARTLLARIAEFHETPTNPAAAREHYRWLIEHEPASEAGQLAMVKIAILDLADPSHPDALKRRYEDLVSWDERLTFAPARRDFHLTLADVCLSQGWGAERALHHCLHAYAAGVQQPNRLASLHVRIAELARELGRNTLAVEHYRLFLSRVEDRDNRVQLVRNRLAALTAASRP